MTLFRPVVGGLVTAVIVSTQLAAVEVRYTVADLGTLGGSASAAGGINNKGQVVGWANLPDDPYTYHAFLWNGSGPLQDLGTLGGAESRAYGINDGGEIVGWSDMPGVPYSQHGFRTRPNMPITPSQPPPSRKCGWGRRVVRIPMCQSPHPPCPVHRGMAHS